MKFQGDYSIEVRAFDDGIAYRFITNFPDDVEVVSEDFVISFPDEYLAHLQQPSRFKTAYEEPYSEVETAKWNQDDKMSTLPVLIDTRKGYKVLVSESGLSDYPCMFLKGTSSNGMQAAFPKVPTEFGRAEVHFDDEKNNVFVDDFYSGFRDMAVFFDYKKRWTNCGKYDGLQIVSTLSDKRYILDYAWSG